MSHTTECPQCKHQWIKLDKISAEFELNLLKAENACLRGTLESLLDRPHEQHCDWLDPGPDQCNCLLKEARAALEET